MKTVVKQTFYLFFILILMTLAVAGIFFVLVKNSENKNRELMTEVFATSTAKNVEIEPIVKNEPIVATTTKEVKETTTSTPAEDKEEVKNEEKEDVEEKKPVEEKNTTSTEPVAGEKVIWNVPFTSQAPFGDWNDPKQSAGCEEASLLMAVHWITGKPLSPSIALKEIVAMADYEMENYGVYYDTSAADTLKLFKDYFGYNNAYVEYDVSLADVKKALKAGNVVQVPVVGTLLGNPFFTAPGPPLHQLLIIGYDDTKREFITNDPGTRHGASYRYKYSTMMSALRDYPTGHNEINNSHVAAMIVIGKNQN